MFDQSNEFFEIVRSSIFAYLIIALPIFVSISPTCLAVKDFPAFRLQQFELHGTSYGTTGSLMNLETRVIPGAQIVQTPRRCYLVKLVDLTVTMYRELLKVGVAGIAIIIPKDFSQLDIQVKEQIQELEQVMLDEAESTSVPIYFIQDTEDVEEIYETVKESAESLSAKSSGLQVLLHHVYGNGIQLVSSLSTPKAVSDAQIVSVQGALIGAKSNKNFPILISAHYDSMSPAAELSFGGDSNGSGATALLELARLFSHLYNRGGTVKGRPNTSLLFLLSGAGQFNYQGTQKYLEDQIDSLDHGDLQDTRLVICLDSLTAHKNKLYIHLSRSIREGTMLNSFIQNLVESSSRHSSELKVEVVQRKIRTEGLLAWEHEKFHLKKINAVTLSSYENSKDLSTSLLDTKDTVNLEDLTLKVRVIAEAIAATMYNVSGVGTAFSGSLGVSEESLSSMLDFIASQPRSAQLLATKQNKFVNSLRSLLNRYTHETTLFTMKPDKRDANLVFYDSNSGVISSYDVKPAVFDLVLSVAIAIYLSVVYIGIKNFAHFYCSVAATSHGSGVNGNSVSHSQSTKTKAQ